MEEEFYATIKLSSGEELLSKVCYLSEEHKLLLDNPLLVEKIIQKNGSKHIEGFVLKDWINSSYENMFIINMNQVITVSEMDKKIQTFYLSNLNKENTDYSDNININPNKFSYRMGYLGSINATKQLLEDIFNNS